MPAQGAMILHTIVVEEGIVDIEQEDNLGRLAHTGGLLVTLPRRPRPSG